MSSNNLSTRTNNMWNTMREYPSYSQRNLSSPACINESVRNKSIAPSKNTNEIVVLNKIPIQFDENKHYILYDSINFIKKDDLLKIAKAKNVTLILNPSDIKIMMCSKFFKIKLTDANESTPEISKFVSDFNGGSYESINQTELTHINTYFSTGKVDWVADISLWPNLISNGLYKNDRYGSNIFKTRFNSIFIDDTLTVILTNYHIKLSSNSDLNYFNIICLLNSLLHNVIPPDDKLAVLTTSSTIPTIFKSTTTPIELKSAEVYQGLLYSIYTSDKVKFCHYHNKPNMQYLFSNGGLSKQLLENPKILMEYYAKIKKLLGNHDIFKSSTLLQFSRLAGNTPENSIEYINTNLKNIVNSICNNTGDVNLNIVYLVAISHEFKCNEIQLIKDKCTKISETDEVSSDDSSSELSPMFSDSKNPYKKYNNYYNNENDKQIQVFMTNDEIPFINTQSDGKIILVSLGKSNNATIINLVNNELKYTLSTLSTSNTTQITNSSGNYTLTNGDPDKYHIYNKTNNSFPSGEIKIDLATLSSNMLLSKIKNSEKIYYSGKMNNFDIFRINCKDQIHKIIVDDINDKFINDLMTHCHIYTTARIAEFEKNRAALIDTVSEPAMKTMMTTVFDQLKKFIEEKEKIQPSISNGRAKYLKYKNKYLALKQQLGLN